MSLELKWVSKRDARVAAIDEAFAVRPSDVLDVKYARSGDVAIAYQVVGEGPADIVFVRGITGDLLSTWEQPLLVRHVKGLAACGRLLMLDKRGTGLSDRVREVQSLETTMDDVRAVMDAAARNPPFSGPAGRARASACSLRPPIPSAAPASSSSTQG